jgi:hypothetical protein
MKAIFFETHGDIDVLRYGNGPIRLRLPGRW